MSESRIGGLDEALKNIEIYLKEKINKLESKDMRIKDSDVHSVVRIKDMEFAKLLAYKDILEQIESKGAVSLTTEKELNTDKIGFKIEFACTDEFNQETRVKKSLNIDVLYDTTPIDFMLEEFKLFLIMAGYSKDNVDKINIKMQ